MKEHVQDLMEYYEDSAQMINAYQEPEVVFENLESRLVRKQLHAADEDSF